LRTTVPPKYAGAARAGADAAESGAVAEQAGLGHLLGVGDARGRENIRGIGRVGNGCVAQAFALEFSMPRRLVCKRGTLSNLFPLLHVWLLSPASMSTRTSSIPSPSRDTPRRLAPSVFFSRPPRGASRKTELLRGRYLRFPIDLRVTGFTFMLPWLSTRFLRHRTLFL
jgi:hypothetical protein